MLYLKENHQELDAVVFDLGNVLLDYDPPRFMKDIGVPDQYHELMGNILFNNKNIWPKWDLGVLDREGIIQQAILVEPSLKDEIIKYMENWDNYFYAVPHNVAAMYRIKETGTKVYVLSNFSQETFEKIKERNAFLSDFDGMVISYQHHLIKPDPRIYRLLIETYNINTARAVFIDDLEENVKAGREAGFFGIHLPPCADVTPYFLFPEGQETVENSEFRQETK